ncbi:MAG TPA: hypothetical protein VHS09_09160 [Polyangiaceae bacterium]|nr:hypothetical protein [Polyangiaceae bacterium]
MIVRARTVCIALPFALAGALLACKDEATSAGSGGPAPSATAATTVAAATSASVSAAPPPPPPPPCSAETAFVIDKGARLDTGLTSVEIENGKQVAVGYAVGDGAPRVAMVDATGAVSKADPDWSHVKDQEAKKDPAMVRHVFRVTPLGILKTGKMRVGMDFLDSFPAGKGTGSYLRCGAADSEPVISDDGGSQFDDPSEDQVAKLPAGSDTDGATVDYRDCRTFGSEKKSFVLATQVKREGPGDDHNLLYSWVVDELPGKGMIKDAVVDKRVVKPTKDGKYPKIEHFVTPVAIQMGDLGVLITARDQGNIVFVKRSAKLEKAGEPKSMWLGASAGMPALDMQNGQVYVMTTEFQKSDLYGVLFPATSTPEKPQKVALTDPSASGDAPRDSASMDVTSAGDLAVAFVDGKAPSRRARLTVLGADLKQKLPTVFDVSPDGVNVSEARVVSLSTGKFLVTYLQGDGQLSGQLVSCKY